MFDSVRLRNSIFKRMHRTGACCVLFLSLSRQIYYGVTTTLWFITSANQSIRGV